MLSLPQAASSFAKDRPLPISPLNQHELILLRWYRLLDDNDQGNVMRFVSAMAKTRSQRPR